MLQFKMNHFPPEHLNNILRVNTSMSKKKRLQWYVMTTACESHVEHHVIV